jgi:hypothetical protein
MLKCYHCGAEWTRGPRPPFRAVCDACEAYISVCLNCKDYDPTASGRCRLRTTEPVRFVDRPNFCEEFRYLDRPADWTPDKGSDAGKSARDKFDSLFQDT